MALPEPEDVEMQDGDFVAPSSPPQVYDSEGDGEDLFGDQYEADYQHQDDLDRYENVDVDDEELQEPITLAERQAAEQEMYSRDRRQGRRAQVPFGMSPEDEDIQFGLPQHMLEPAEFEQEMVNVEDFAGPLDEWLLEPRVQREVKRKFREFLTAFRDEGGRSPYPIEIQQMVVRNKRSLKVSYLHISAAYPALAIWVADCPALMLELFDEVAEQAANEMFPGYSNIQSQIRVRLTNLPISDKLRELRHTHLNMLVKVTGVVTRRTDVYPQLESVKFDCLKCGYIMGPYLQKGKEENKPKRCPQCSSTSGFKLNIEETFYRNFQKLRLQEPPGSVPAGRVPRSREVILIDDLVDTVKPGEQINLTGIYVNQMDHTINIQAGFPVFQTVIEANYIEKEDIRFTRDQITEEEERKFQEWAKRPDMEELIINSIAPSIYGYRYIKLALAFAMFGGQEKLSKEKHRVRGDINVLILGDPGCGKSQFLKWVENVAPRAVYATGKGASAVGLTAAVRKDPVTQEWTLEGGALVLADRGICMIDEFDKMNEQDRTSIHEAMEQQSISISKAGIVTRLQARCSVIAAANPLSGTYDGSLTFLENVDLTDPILSRFDILAVVRDVVNPRRDEEIANWVVDNHMRSHPEAKEENEENPEDHDRPEHLSADDLKKYIMFAKATCNPKLNNIDREKIARFYSELRQKSMEGGGIPIAVRHIESVLRMAEAHARMHLRDMVVEEDVDIAIRTLLESFIATQKLSVSKALERHFVSYLQYRRDNIEILMHLLDEEVREASHLASRDDISVELKHFQRKALDYSIHDVNTLFTEDRFTNAGYSFDSETKRIIKTFQRFRPQMVESQV